MTGGTWILALDTSHPTGSVAVVADGEIAGEIVFDASETHSATLMPAIDACLCASKRTIPGIDLFAVVSGPGSFTGLRIGLATVKAFAAIRRRPVAAVGSLELLAAAIPFAPVPVVPLIDARRGEVYAAAYDTAAGTPSPLLDPCAASPKDVPALLAASGIAGPVVLCGSGAVRYADQLRAALPPGTAFAGPRWAVPSAALLAALAAERPPVPYGELAALEPVYIRPPDARLPRHAPLRSGGDGRP